MAPRTVEGYTACMRLRIAGPALAVGLVCSACGGTAPKTQPTSRGSDPSGAETTTGGRTGESSADSGKTEVSPRSLTATARYGDLVASARRLDDRGQTGSDAGCLLRGTGQTGVPWRLEADVAVAVRPLPDAPTQLPQRLRDAPGPARVLSRWGQYGRAEPDLALVAFTAAPPPQGNKQAVVVFVTQEGLHLRRSNEAVADAHAGPFPPSELATHLKALRTSELDLLAVTASASTSLSRLRHVLMEIPTDGAPVTLAVPLAKQTRLPERGSQKENGSPDPKTESAGLCEDGLPAPPDDAPDGELEPQAISDSLRPLREGGRRCLAHANASGAGGGLLRIQLRIAADGTVDTACITSDGIGDSNVRTCVLDVVRDLQFPKPRPEGVVDVELPLRLTPRGSLRQRPLCRSRGL
jgi:hypothetical protein